MKITIQKDLLKAVFVLEDDPGRIGWFKRKFADAPVLFITKDVNEAISNLHSTKFDIIFLDHDLDCEEDMLADERIKAGIHFPNGLRVAEEIKDTINQLTPCIIHSMNPTGAGNMVKAHPFEVSMVPFHILRTALEVV